MQNTQSSGPRPRRFLRRRRRGRNRAHDAPVVMITDANDILIDPDPDADALDSMAAPVFGTLPADLVVTERAAAALRAYLAANGLAHYRIFFGCADLADVEDHLDAGGGRGLGAPRVHDRGRR